jgi:ribosomal protection tetracycline resistance protein
VHHTLRQGLHGWARAAAIAALTSGEGVLETTFGGYAPISGPVPTRPRTDRNPLDREEYLLRVARRM